MSLGRNSRVTITVVGSLNMDLFLELPHLPRPGETVMGTGFRREPGGKGANQACAAAAMGARVNLVGAVGRDSFGETLLTQLRRQGVNCRWVSRCPESTGTACILLDAAGRNQIAVIPGANAAVTVRHVAAAAGGFVGARALLTQLESPLAVVEASLKLARRKGMMTVLNPAPYRPLPVGLLRRCNWIILNEIELTQLTGMKANTLKAVGQAARRLSGRSGGANVAVTLGARGAWIEAEDFRGRIHGYAVGAVDTVGAGDTFIGAFVTRLLEGAGAAEAGVYGCAAAALAVTRRGAQTSIPQRWEVVKLVQSKPIPVGRSAAAG